MRETEMSKKWIVLYCIPAIVLGIGFWGTVLYLGWHFVTKLWFPE